MELKAIIIFNEIAYGFYGSKQYNIVTTYFTTYDLFSFFTNKNSFGKFWQLKIISFNPLYPDVKIHKKILKSDYPNIQIIISTEKKWINEISNEIKEITEIIYNAQKEIIKIHPNFK